MRGIGRRGEFRNINLNRVSIRQSTGNIKTTLSNQSFDSDQDGGGDINITIEWATGTQCE